MTLRGSASDANHSYDQLTATWYSGSEIICEATVPESDGTVQCDTTLVLTESEVSLEVKDAGNAMGSDTVTLTVVPTAAPDAMIITPESSGMYYSDQLITFSGVVTDEEDSSNLLSVYWESSLDGALSDVDAIPESDGSLLGYGYLTEGEHAIELHVADTTGKTDRASVIIEVGPPNSAPLCAITAPSDGSAGPEGESVQFVATASDVDVSSDMLTVTWSSDKDGEIGTSVPNSAGEISFTTSDLSVNTHNISMQVSDEVGATCTATLDYTVGTPPSIIIGSPVDGNVLNAGEPILFSATVSDAQDQPDEVLLDWQLDGVSISTQGATSSGTAEFSDNSLGFGVYNLAVTATDTDGLTDSDQVNFTVNGLPTQPVVRIDPNPVNTNDTLSAVMDIPSTDPEGNSVSYTYEWLLGGVVQSAYTSSTLPSSATLKNEYWTVRVTPNDGIADGLAGEASITIDNIPPTLSGLAIAPANNVTNDITLTCSVVVTDPDDTLTPAYEWSIGSSVVGSGSTLDLAAVGAMPDDVVTCAASVVDGNGASAADSTTAIVLNRAPIVSGAVITPSTGVTTATALTCSATVVDDDGESPTVAYEWQVGSSAYSGDSLSLDNTIVSPGDTVTCTVSASDAFGGTASDSASVTVDNTLPTVTASITANGSTNAGELTCSATASDVDDAPSAPTLDFEWFDAAGVPLGTSNPLQLDSSMGVDGDAISCVATATDQSGESASDTAFHTITNSTPVIDSISLTPATLTANTASVTCLVTGSDADGDTVAFAY
ncbi:MAG: hypothetical protein VX026_02420, partial [Myxococcota bacterium]|nr:hypothetical protein [Myxococcota bacterium]